MKVVVATTSKHCPATLALRMEGIEHELGFCRGDYGYGKLLTRLWQEGEGFIIVEHDIVPWPGALKMMWKCAWLWCGYSYPYYTYRKLASERLLGSHSCGCVKFSDGLVQGWPDLPVERKWERQHWQKLDGLVGRSIVKALQDMHIFTWHEHGPPVAHARKP